MICSSLNLLLRIVRLLSGGYGLYPNLEEFAGLRSLPIPRPAKEHNGMFRFAIGKTLSTELPASLIA
jgi:hypothetical protein